MTDTFNLRESVKEKLKLILDKKASYAIAPVKAGRFKKNPLYIYSAEAYVRRNKLFCYSTDELAHALTMSGQDFEKTISHLIVLPESTRVQGHLLSHIFYPDRRALAIYMYPRRLDKKQTLFSEERQQSIASPGLLSSVLERLQHMNISGLFLFLLQTSLLSGQELAILEQEHRRTYEDAFC